MRPKPASCRCTSVSPSPNPTSSATPPEGEAPGKCGYLLGWTGGGTGWSCGGWGWKPATAQLPCSRAPSTTTAPTSSGDSSHLASGRGKRTGSNPGHRAPGDATSSKLNRTALPADVVRFHASSCYPVVWAVPGVAQCAVGDLAIAAYREGLCPELRVS